MSAVATDSIPRGIPPMWRGKPLRHFWPYRGVDGCVLGYVARYDHDGEDKEVIPFFQRDGKAWKPGGPEEPKPLYGLDLISGLPSDSTVYIVEGEKVAAAIHSLGLSAVTSGGGSGAAAKADWTPLSRFSRIVILPDADEPGEHYAESVAALLAALPGSHRISIARLAGLPDSGDVVDWIQARLLSWDGFEEVPPDEVNGLREALLEAIESCKEEVKMSEIESAQWPDPEPLPDSLLSVEPFEPGLLPELMRPWVEDTAERIQCPLDFPAIGAMVVLASVVGRQIGIRPKAYDDWIVVPNLWGAVVGRPGVMKTPALAEPMKPLLRLEAEAAKFHEQACKEFDAAKMVADANKAVLKDKIKEAVKKGTGNPIEEALAAIDIMEAAEPARRRYIVNDTTVEKLGEILAANSNGVLVFRDELTGFLKSLDKEGREGARSFYLEAWSGIGGFTYDRIGRGTLDIESACVSILGGIQPGPLLDYLRSTVRGGLGDDGLIQRFQLLVWPDVGSSWRNVDRWPDGHSKNAVYEQIERLAVIDSAAMGATVDDSSPIPFLRFSPDAQESFNEWRAELEHRLRDNEDHPAIEAHLAKYRSLVPSLALLIHVFDGNTGDVATQPLEKACAWAEYLESHARRVYSAGVTADIEASRVLRKRILRGDLSDTFTARDVYRKHWAGLSNTEEAEAALKVLEDCHIVAGKMVMTGGRSSRFYAVNPQLREAG